MKYKCIKPTFLVQKKSKNYTIYNFYFILHKVQNKTLLTFQHSLTAFEMATFSVQFFFIKCYTGFTIISSNETQKEPRLLSIFLIIFTNLKLTWHLIPIWAQAHVSGSQNPRHLQPHSSRETRIYLHSSFSRGSIFLTPAAFSITLRCRGETGCRKAVESDSESEPVWSLASSSESESSLDEAANPIRRFCSCSFCRAHRRCSAAYSASVENRVWCMCDAAMPSVQPPCEGTHMKPCIRWK